MKKLTTLLSSIIAIVGFGLGVNAQCPAGQVDVTVDVSTDTWGYECYWELTPTGSACGTGTIGAYGNTVEVGCLGGGLQVAATGSGYGDNILTTENLGCMTSGACFDIHYVDDWGDGGATFEVYIDGALTETFVGAGTGGIFTFCANGAAGSDASITAVYPHPYTMVPAVHTTAVALSADVTNSGTSAITNVVVNAEVFNGATSMSTENSTPIATMAPAAMQTVGFTAYTPAPGVNSFVFTSSMTETDDVPANDAMTFMVDVNDSIYARDNGVQLGALGIGAPNENGRLGQVFSAVVSDAITSITAQFVTPGDADMTTFRIYEMSGGLPGTELGATGSYTFNTAESTGGATVTMAFATPIAVTAGMDYFISVDENAVNISLATNNYAVVPNTNFVTWDTNPNGAGVWTPAETFGAAFEIQYILRANFGLNSSIAEKEYSVGAYPNPATDVLTLDVPAELLGSVYTVLDQTGRLVAQGNVNELATKVDLSSFDKGMYVIKIDAGNVTLNVVKQ